MAINASPQTINTPLTQRALMAYLPSSMGGTYVAGAVAALSSPTGPQVQLLTLAEVCLMDMLARYVQQIGNSSAAGSLAPNSGYLPVTGQNIHNNGFLQASLGSSNLGSGDTVGGGIYGPGRVYTAIVNLITEMDRVVAATTLSPAATVTDYRIWSDLNLPNAKAQTNQSGG